MHDTYTCFRGRKEKFKFHPEGHQKNLVREIRESVTYWIATSRQKGDKKIWQRKFHNVKFSS